MERSEIRGGIDASRQSRITLRSGLRFLPTVMAGLVPAIHAFGLTRT